MQWHSLDKYDCVLDKTNMILFFKDEKMKTKKSKSFNQLILRKEGVGVRMD